jgi:sugar phosphate isomerase/epimerase
MSGEARITAPESVRRRLAFSTLGTPGQSLAAAADIAVAAGVPGLEARSAPDGQVAVAMGRQERADARGALAARGVVLVAVDTYVGLAEEHSRADLDAELRLAADLGAPAVRVFMRDESAEPAEGAGPTDGERRAIARLVASLQTVRATGVRILLETHDRHASARRLAAFMRTLDEAVPDHGVGVVWDCAHPWSRGEALAESFRLLVPWLGYVQVKDERSRHDPVPCVLGAGTFPADELTVVLDDGEWSGWVSLEWERQWHPELPPVAEALAAFPTWAPGLVTEGERRDGTDDEAGAER